MLEDCTLSLITERRLSRPWGLEGGESGAPGENWLLPGGSEADARCSHSSPLLDWPVLPDDVRGQLNTLRRHRNDVAHGGSGAEVPDYGECGRLLVAALAAIHYLRIVGSGSINDNG